MKKHKRKSFIKSIFSFLLIIVALAWVGSVFKDKPFKSAAIYDEFDENEEEWCLTLVNPWNPVPDGFEVELTDLKHGEKVDSRMYPHLQKMFDDARADGIYPVVYSSYRTQAKQQWLYDSEIADYVAKGYSREEAEAIARTWVAYPGTSEHQIGLAVDIDSENKAVQSNEMVWDWLAKNSYKYGFIYRYQEDKTDITGINPEPWHYRYVGQKAAKEIYEKGICFEEYLESL